MSTARGLSTNMGISGNAVLLDEHAQEVDDLLRPLERERGNDDLPSALDGRPDRSREHFGGLVDRRVSPPAVRALDDQVIDVGRRLGIPEDRHVLPAEIDRVGEPRRGAVLPQLEERRRRSEHVPGVVEGHRYAVRDFDRHVVPVAAKTSERLLGVLAGVERGAGRKPLLATDLVDESDVLFLDMPAVGKHLPAEVAGRLGRVDLPAKAPLHEARYIAAVVDMRVGEDACAELARIEGEAGVLLERFVAPSLEQPAIDENSGAAELDRMHGPRDRSRSADEFYPCAQRRLLS